MKAVVYKGKNKVAVEEAPDPKLEGWAGQELDEDFVEAE
jgi:hypothetical protein